MDMLDIAKRRSSVRGYLAQPVEPEKLEKLLQAAHVAPTAANRQPVRLLVVQSAEGLSKLARGADLYGAPLAIVVCTDRRRAWVRPFDGKSSGDIDAAIVTDHMMLEAAGLGLGTCWICYFDPEVIREEFALPEYLEPVNILAVGSPKGAPADPERHSRTRIPLRELVSWEDFG